MAPAARILRDAALRPLIETGAADWMTDRSPYPEEARSAVARDEGFAA
jgi:hypothetical protein